MKKNDVVTVEVTDIGIGGKRIRISCICTLSGGKTLWRMPDSGDGLPETAGV